MGCVTSTHAHHLHLESAMRPASFGQRYLALFLDLLFLEILGALIAFPFIQQVDLNLRSVLISLFTGHRIDQESLTFILVYSAILTALGSWYFVGFIGNNGQTPGKKLVGIQVRQQNGSPVNYSIAANRFFIGYSISTIPFGLGFYWALFDTHNEAWHDKIASTRVIRF
ncbi:MAG: RDD family protein [Nitrospina sp.]|nr:MAG: RDD family protein [Nitrospina sp.]